jgi:hypothetical protein
VKLVALDRVGSVTELVYDCLTSHSVYRILTHVGAVYLAYVIGVWCVLFPPSFPANTAAPATAVSVEMTAVGTSASAGWISRRSEWFLQV